jgi:hypothetical protein
MLVCGGRTPLRDNLTLAASTWRAFDQIMRIVQDTQG